MTLRHTFRPGPLACTGSWRSRRVSADWSEWLRIQAAHARAPDAIYFQSSSPSRNSDSLATIQQVTERLIYFSFATLTSVSYGDAIHTSRCTVLAMAEALIGQLYPAILIATSLDDVTGAV